MRIEKLVEKIDDRNKLFNAVLAHEPDITLGGPSDHVRNLVNKGKYNGKSVFIKIGLNENLTNLLEFYKNPPTFTSFNIPRLVSSEKFKLNDLDLVYIIEEEVPGESLYESKKFYDISQNIIDAVLEIDSSPNLSLQRSRERKNQLMSQDGYTFYKEKLEKLLNGWYENSTIKFKSLLDSANEILNSIETLELGTAHGELNFHHIFYDSTETLYIIDWERFSQATIRFFDLQEYLSRILVFQNDFTLVENMMSDFRDRNIKFDEDTFQYGLYHRVIGSLYEAAVDNRDIDIKQDDESKVLEFIDSIFD